MKKLAFILMVFMGMNTYGQTDLVVRIIDAESGVGIPYITARVPNEYVHGFVADEFGRITIDSFFVGKQFEFRGIGYTSVLRTLDRSIDTIQLRTSMLTLREVIVRPDEPQVYLTKAIRNLPWNYSIDSFATHNYYREQMTENDRLVHNIETFIEVKHPGYLIERDSFSIRIKAGRESNTDELHFMEKEREKEWKKEKKKAAKKGKAYEQNEIPFEVISPFGLFLIDPLRHLEQTWEINDDNVGFLDSNNLDVYRFWHGSPQRFGNRSLMVIHFGPQEDVNRPLMAGTLWLDPETLAFVKISFGLSEEGKEHLLPGYAKAALWLYGLKYDLGNTKVEFEYRQVGQLWRLHASRASAYGELEKRRLFSSNEVSRFDYSCEMLTTRTVSMEEAFTSDHEYHYPEFLSHQLKDVPDHEWQKLMKERRTVY